MTSSSRVVTPKSETLTTVSTMDACVSTEDEDFNDIEDDEEEGDDDKEMSSWRDRCLHLDFVARIAKKLFTLLTERFFRKYSPRSDLDHMMINLMNPAQDWADEDLPGDADGDPCH